MASKQYEQGYAAAEDLSAEELAKWLVSKKFANDHASGMILARRILAGRELES